MNRFVFPMPIPTTGTLVLSTFHVISGSVSDPGSEEAHVSHHLMMILLRGNIKCYEGDEATERICSNC